MEDKDGNNDISGWRIFRCNDDGDSIYPELTNTGINERKACL